MRKKKDTIKKIIHSGETFKHRRIYKLNNIQTSKEIHEESKILNDSFQRSKQIYLLEKEKELKSVFEKIDKEIRLFNNPEVIKAKRENDAFNKEYSKTLKESLNSINSKYSDLFQKYLDKGYEIKQFTNDYNLFKLNPLIDEKIGKIYLYYFSKFQNHDIKRYKNKKHYLSDIKAVSYLYKIDNIMFPKVDDNTKNKSAKQNIKSNKTKKKINLSKKIKENIIRENIFVNKENRLNKIYSKSSNVKSKSSKIKQDPKKEISEKKQKDNIENINNNKTYNKSSINLGYILLNKEKNIKKYPTTGKKIAENRSIINSGIKVNLGRLFSKESNEKKISYVDSTKHNDSSQKKIYFKNKYTNMYETPKIIKTNKKYNFKLLNDQHDLPSNKSNTKQFTISNTIENNLRKKNDTNSITDIKEFNLSSNRSHLKSVTTDTSTNSGQRSNRTHFFSYIEKNKNKINEDFLLISENNKNLKTSINNTNINDDVEKIYNRIKSGNIKNIEKNIIRYLKNTKKMSSEEINELLDKFNYKNYLNNVEELKHSLLENNMYKKSEWMYINNFGIKKPERLLKKLNEKDEDIIKLAKKLKLSKYYIKNENFDN